MRIVSKIKSLVIRPGARPRKVAFGIFRNMLLELDLSHDMQLCLGLWERETYACVKKAAARCKWAVDVGAGRGELCVFLVKRSSAKRIVAVEPKISEAEFIKRNLGLNGEQDNPKVEILNKFVGCSQDQDSVSLDALSMGSKEPGFVKIDVDGAEMDVLKSGEEILRKGSVDILLETHSAELETASLEFLAKLGYQTKVIPNAWWRIVLPERRPIPHNRWLWATNISGQ